MKILHFWLVFLSFTWIEVVSFLPEVSRKGFHLKGLESRILNGDIAESGQFPWQAAIFEGTSYNRHKYMCGGSLIRRQWILTAAHCVIKFSQPSKGQDFVKFRKRSQLSVFLGSIFLPESLKTNNKGQLFLNKLVIYVHQNAFFPYDDENLPVSQMRVPNNDIALIKLLNSVSLNTNIQPIELVNKGINMEMMHIGFKFYASGWGMTEDMAKNGIPTSDDLRFAQMTLLSKKSNDICLRATDYLCVTGTQQTCKFDSGGPLVYYNKTGTPFLVGVTGAGVKTNVERKDDPTCEFYEFDFSLNVYKFREWILDTIGEIL